MHAKFALSRYQHLLVIAVNIILYTTEEIIVYKWINSTKNFNATLQFETLSALLCGRLFTVHKLYHMHFRVMTISAEETLKMAGGKDSGVLFSTLELF